MQTAVLATPVVAQPTSFSVTYLDAFGSFGFNEGQFNTPGHIAVLQKSVLVADTHNHRIQRFLTSGTFEYSFKTIQDDDSPNGQLDSPFGLATDPLRGIFVSDIGSSVVYGFDTYGSYLQKIGGFGAIGVKFNEPVALAIDLQGFLYIVDRKNQRITKCDASGAKLFQVPQAEGNLTNPSDIIVFDDGQFWVLDDQGVKSYNELGKFLGQVILTTGAAAMAIDGNKTIYLAKPEQKSVELYTPTGSLLLTLDFPFKRPLGLCISDDLLFVSDASAHQILRFKITGLEPPPTPSKGTRP
ncbi:MAG: NHL repeat-containing protein [Candidatus Margulisiibacteriota bacterium]